MSNTAKANDNELCPYCGSDGDMPYPVGFTGKRNIECIGCGARGPTESAIALAWAAWNKRHAQPDQVELVEDVL